MNEVLTGILIIMVLFGISWFLHFIKNSVSLTPDEVIKLAQYRRFDKINDLLNFVKYPIKVDPEFKSKMRATGKLYEINQDLKSFPSLVASLLKSKKHEWIVIAFCKNKVVCNMWVNKGIDSQSVSLNIGIEDLIEFSKKNGIDYILGFHNHPNTVIQPSEQDIISANFFGKFLIADGISYLAFVVGKGRYQQYAWWIKESVFSFGKYSLAIKSENNNTMSSNYRLRMELRRRDSAKQQLLAGSLISTNLF